MDRNYHRSRCSKNCDEEESSLTKSNTSRNGLVGLQNLGNTCFMNTSLQCLSNCYELTEYFLLDLFRKDINKDNPIGTGGDLASSYAIFLKNLWYGNSSVYSPWAFKRAISGFQSMFSGYMQHDTQEFLNFLLDGLHEDLNRVLKKPLVDKDDSKKPDETKSVETWIGFLRRNQSLLVDLFYGQFKSTLYCPDPECQNISTCFDPYLSISLPLVSRTEPYELTCFFIFFDCSTKPLQLDVQFSIETTIMALRNKVGKMLQIHPFSFLIAKFENLGAFDCFLNSQNLLKPPNYSNSKKQQYFLFQIDPKIFYNPNFNKFVLADSKESQKKIGSNNNSWEINKERNYKNTKAEIEKDKSVLNELFDVDYEENENGGTHEEEIYYSKKLTRGVYKITVDENYGFDGNWLKVVIYMKRYENNFSTGSRLGISFPRIVYINKNWTLKYIHKYVFDYISHVIKITNEADKDLTNEKLYDKYYSKLIEHNNNKAENNNYDNINIDNLLIDPDERKSLLASEFPDEIEAQKEGGLPYRLRVFAFSGKTENFRNEQKSCYFCLNQQCLGCPLPFSDTITLKQYISEIPKNEFGKEIDNTYFYLHERYKHFVGLGNRDFMLELSFVDEYHSAVKTLLEKEVIDFKVQQNERADGIEVIECFKNFIKLETLETNNEWFCPDCKNHVKATKKMEIFNSPNILIIHLKRFKNTSKIDTLVKFPLEDLDISDFVINKKNGEEKFIYDLFAVANHFGSINFGHYTAYAKNCFNNKWYDFDDSHVSEMNGKDIVTTSAYVLFYRKRNMKETVDLQALYNKSIINFEDAVKNEIPMEQMISLLNNANVKNNGGVSNRISQASHLSNGEECDGAAMEIESETAVSDLKTAESGFIDLNNSNRKC
jgi:ubiquitin carboxyl-terminal hydrolase 4/11/15